MPQTKERAGTQTIYIDEKTDREPIWLVKRRMLACGEYPTALLLQKLPNEKYLATNVFCWGVILLGELDPCVQPAFIVMLDFMWVCDMQTPYSDRDTGVLVDSINQITFYLDLFLGSSLGSVASPPEVTYYSGNDIKSKSPLDVVTDAWNSFIGCWLASMRTGSERIEIECARANEIGILNKSHKCYQMIGSITNPTSAIISTTRIYSTPLPMSDRTGLLIVFDCTRFFLAESFLIFSLIS
ncbi:hypothetical protein CDEST_08246 [Colletotrichum destructivum]|uniref:Uncharacterized protein n=1 Tax=Colletotrichum destructivum TaxID=34406 RepID=A0AAX4IIH6_9PEZI|nr:hypothetical protein CDEST_08246 [Colletotrichum destructivum]